MVNMTQEQINETARYIETVLFEHYLRSDQNISAIGIAASECGANCLDYYLLFIVEELEDTLLPVSFRISDSIELKAHKLRKRSIQKSFDSFEKGNHKRRDPVRPGVSIGGRGTAGGTLGAIIFHNSKPHLLSCHHVLGGTNTDVFQPGRLAAPNNGVGRVVRHDSERDCAISDFTRRVDDHDRHVLQLNIIPGGTRNVAINDKVIKYGNATGKTNGKVGMIKVIRRTSLPVRFIKNQFLVRLDPDHLPSTGEISDDGDSGAAFFEYSEQNDSATPLLLGIITDGDPYFGDKVEYTYATEMIAIQETLDINF
jgi:hypothetical protein